MGKSEKHSRHKTPRLFKKKKKSPKEGSFKLERGWGWLCRAWAKVEQSSCWLWITMYSLWISDNLSLPLPFIFNIQLAESFWSACKLAPVFPVIILVTHHKRITWLFCFWISFYCIIPNRRHYSKKGIKDCLNHDLPFKRKLGNKQMIFLSKPLLPYIYNTGQ